MDFAVVSGGAEMSKFLAMAASANLRTMFAKFCPAQIRGPIPNGMKLEIMVASIEISAPFAPVTGFGGASRVAATIQRSGSNLSGSGKSRESRWSACGRVAMMVPAGIEYPPMVNGSPFADFSGATRSRGEGMGR